MRVSVIAPVYNEVDFIGYSLMAIANQIHEVVYACADSLDGTDELLAHIKEKYYGDKLKILRKPEYNFNPLDMAAYNNAFNDCIEESTGDACWFLHPDMLVTNPEAIANLSSGPLAWYTNVSSYAGDFYTQITKGRTNRWKNIHAKDFGLTYLGGYGSANEDFYHTDITGTALNHYGEEFSRYPFEVMNSGININHYCELKSYKRRLEKMKLCLRTQMPKADPRAIEELASVHPRVTLEPSTIRFGHFEFSRTEQNLPSIIETYQAEFSAFKKEPVLV